MTKQKRSLGGTAPLRATHLLRMRNMLKTCVGVENFHLASFPDPNSRAGRMDGTTFHMLCETSEAHGQCHQFSDDASYVTGADIPVDGGYLSRP